MARDRDLSPDPILMILHYLGLLFLLVGLVTLLPWVFTFGLPWGLTYSGFMLITLSAVIRHI